MLWATLVQLFLLSPVPYAVITHALRHFLNLCARSHCV